VSARSRKPAIWNGAIPLHVNVADRLRTLHTVSMVFFARMATTNAVWYAPRRLYRRLRYKKSAEFGVITSNDVDQIRAFFGHQLILSSATANHRQ
jgi:hypothetical protein